MFDEHGRVLGLEDNVHVRCYKAYDLVKDQLANLTDWYFEMQPACVLEVVFCRSDGDDIRVCVTDTEVVLMGDE